MTIDRREFLKVAGAGAGLLLTEGCALVPGASGAAAPSIGSNSPDIAVIGAGAFGGWTAHYLQQMGAKVLLIDALGAGNSRATSGDETRGVRSSYGDRTTGEPWMIWARLAMERWRAFDEQWNREAGLRAYFTTGDIIMRADWEPFLTQTKEWWEKNKIPFEVLPVEEIRYRWPVIDVTGINAVLYEPDAGVVRARRSCELVAAMYTHAGGAFEIARASTMFADHGKLLSLELSNGRTLRAGSYVFACGPWLGKIFSRHLGTRMRTPMGHVYYMGTPEDDPRYTFPNMPSWNFPGITGWAALPVDNRGFRLRTGGAPAGDPDTSVRWIDASNHERARRFLAERFPGLKNQQILETRACHYESSVNRNFIIDRHPDMSNVWIAGAGNAEGFKFGPVVGEYIARRAAGQPTDPKLDEAFKFPKEEYEETTATQGD